MTERPDTHAEISLRKDFLRSLVRWLVIGVVVTWALAAMSLLAARWIDPPSTAVHIQRRVQALLHHTPYRERYKFIPLGQISLDLQHAVIAAEDARCYQHYGFDWHEVQIAAEDNLEDASFSSQGGIIANATLTLGGARYVFAVRPLWKGRYLPARSSCPTDN